MSKGSTQKDELALALARGLSAAAWARGAGVPRRTAHRWSKDPAVLATVEEIRTRLLDEALGRLVGVSARAVRTLSRLLGAEEGRPESVQLNAAKSILSNVLEIQSHVELTKRIAKIEEQLNERDSRETCPS